MLRDKNKAISNCYCKSFQANMLTIDIFERVHNKLARANRIPGAETILS